MNIYIYCNCVNIRVLLSLPLQKSHLLYVLYYYGNECRMKILKRIAVWILAFVMFFIPSVPLGVSAAETADKIQVDHDKSNDTYFVHDTNIVLFCFV